MRKTHIKANNAYFDELLTFLLSISCMPVGLNFFRVMIGRSSAVPPWPPDQGILLEGKEGGAGQQIRFIPHPYFGQLWDRNWPTEFELEYQPLGQYNPPIQSPESMDSKLVYTTEVLTGCYVLFWEKVKDAIAQKYADDPADWPGVLNFGRVVRNSLAHGNSVEIRSRNAPAASWYRVHIDHLDNGSKMIFGHLGIADVIILMEEIDALL